MRAIVIALSLLWASLAPATQVVWGKTVGVTGIYIIAQDVASNQTLAVSDASGVYSLYVSNGWSGTVAPWTNQVPVVPASYSITNLQTSFHADFTGALTSVSGYLYNTNGMPLAGVPVDFSGADSFTVISAASGLYGASLTNGWTGTVTPAPMFGFNFTPTNQVVTALSSNVVQNFCLGGQWMGGLVTNRFTGLGVDGVTVRVASVSFVTTNSGKYGGLVPYGTAGTLVPSLSYGYFTPTGVVVGPVTSGILSNNFAYSVVYPRVSGRITRYQSAGIGVANVPVKFSDGVTVFADAYGYYSHNAAPGWTGTATPTAPPLTFHPVSYSFTNLTKNQSGRDFEWTPGGMTYQDPLAFLTSRFEPTPVLYTLARADQVSCIPISVLQTNLQVIDAEVAAIVSNVVFQRAYTAELHPEDAWLPANAKALWGGFIVAKDLWATNDATYSTVTVDGETFAAAVAANTATFAAPVGVYGYFDYTNRTLSSQTGTVWNVAPAYTTEVAAVYSIDVAVSGAFTASTATTGLVSVALGLSGRTLAGPALPDVPGALIHELPPTMFHGTMYLDAGMVVQPRLCVATPYVCTVTPVIGAIVSIRARTVPATTTLWE